MHEEMEAKDGQQGLENTKRVLSRAAVGENYVRETLV